MAGSEVVFYCCCYWDAVFATLSGFWHELSGCWFLSDSDCGYDEPTRDQPGAGQTSTRDEPIAGVNPRPHRQSAIATWTHNQLDIYPSLLSSPSFGRHKPDCRFVVLKSSLRAQDRNPVGSGLLIRSRLWPYSTESPAAATRGNAEIKISTLKCYKLKRIAGNHMSTTPTQSTHVWMSK